MIKALAREPLPGTPRGVARADPVLDLFARHFAIDLSADPRACLQVVLRAFARLPYENLSKIVRHAETGSGAAARREPLRVVRDHVALGAGGTCFSLTAALCHLVRALGFAAQPILADRAYGQDTHCALVVWIDGREHLVDPGFLLVDPVPLRAGVEQEIATSFHTVRLAPEPDTRRLALYTVQKGVGSHRLTLKTDPVDWAALTRAWDASFAWDMMRYPLVNQVVDGQHVYMRGARWQARAHDAVRRAAIAPEDLAATIARTFAIDRALVERALRVLREGGETPERGDGPP